MIYVEAEGKPYFWMERVAKHGPLTGAMVLKEANRNWPETYVGLTDLITGLPIGLEDTVQNLARVRAHV